MNFTDSDHESQFSGHNGDKEPESHSDQNSATTSGHSSSNIAPSQPVRSEPNPTAALISTSSPISTPTDADFWNAVTDTLFTDASGMLSEYVNQSTVN